MNINAAITYKIKNAAERDLYWHLMQCDDNFIPPLSTKATVHAYARKIFDKAVTFEAWSEDILVGLVAAYFNDPENVTGYITNVSILSNYMRLGIAGELIKNCIDFAIHHRFDEISLEVNVANDSAIRLYSKFGFVDFGIKGDCMLMKVTGLKDRKVDMF